MHAVVITNQYRDMIVQISTACMFMAQ